jgi:hypothetical protein
VLNLGYYACMATERPQDPDSPVAESQLVELRNMRVLLEEARVRQNSWNHLSTGFNSGE